jgi:hypothetical protein
MRIHLSKPLPPASELAEVLRQEFSDRYAYQLFGLGNAKTIIVGKTTWIGAQISVRENEISIQGTPPSVLAGLLSFLGLTELGVCLVLFMGKFWNIPSQWRQFEKEIGLFLKQKYS